jgi:hypothetical protein
MGTSWCELTTGILSTSGVSATIYSVPQDTEDPAMTKARRQPPRKPAMKFAHLRRKLMLPKLPAKPPKK